jgi:HlyD family secretion protein
VDTAQANLDWYQGKWNSTEVAINAANLAVAQANYDDALREWNRLKDGPDPEDVQAAQARVDAAKATLGMASLTAPFNGTVTEVNSLVGDQVGMGTASFRIDDLSSLLVDVEIPEIDINQIKVGQKVTVTFDAIQGKTYNGEVMEVARAGDVVQGVVNFNVTLKLLDADEQVLPGMTAAVNIIVQQLTDVLLVPSRAIRMSDSKMVVYLLENNQAVPVEISVGASSDTYSEVLSGNVKVGDLIILNPPTEIQPRGANFLTR